MKATEAVSIYNFLPTNYRKILSDRLGCHPNTIYQVVKMLQNDKVLLTNERQIQIAKEALALAADHKKKLEALQQ